MRGLRGEICLANADNQRSNRKWLFRVAFNLWIDECRKNKRSKMSPSNRDGKGDNDIVDFRHANLDSLSLTEELNQVFGWMNELPSTQRQVLYLRTVQEFTVDEVSQTLSISRSSVKANLSIARKKMRQRLEAYEQPNQL